MARRISGRSKTQKDKSGPTAGDYRPTREQLLAFIHENPDQGGKREIARAFGLKGPDRVWLKDFLRQLEDEGLVERKAKKLVRPGGLPHVVVLDIFGRGTDGELLARPSESPDENGPGPLVSIRMPRGAKGRAPGVGERVLAKVFPVEDPQGPAYTARVLKIIDKRRESVLGVIRVLADGSWRLEPVERRQLEYAIDADHRGDAAPGDLVEAEPVSAGRYGLPRAKVTRSLGRMGDEKSASLIAIHAHEIPHIFPDAVIEEAEKAKGFDTGAREDWRKLPLITIDPSDARDHDDAVHAARDSDPANPGGFVIWVAIADVAHHVRPGSELDREARKRGNSTYFPDRVVPMLPDRLSGDLCSLHEGVERAVIAVRMVINAQGEKIAHRFERAMMRSAASLSYEQAQAAFDGRPDAATAPLAEMLGDLNAAWRAMLLARAKRQPLDLDLPERRIVLSEAGEVLSVAFKDRLDAHRVIEEFMVLANVAAAEELIERRSPLLFRIHEEPNPEKIEALREVAVNAGFVLAKGQVLQTRHLNNLLKQAEGSEFDELINMSTLRSMTQAYYSPDNFGHFGLALRNYAHFTSPIRRYSDLIVHRALISAHRWGPEARTEGLSDWDVENLAETAKLISEAERRSMAAERDTTDRYLAAFLAERVGAEFGGRISGVARFGLFVRLDETGADGLVPVRALGNEFFHHDAEAQTLTGERSGQVIGLGQRVRVKLSEAEAVTGGLILELLEVEGEPLARPQRGKRGRYAPRKSAAMKSAKSKARRKRERR